MRLLLRTCLTAEEVRIEDVHTETDITELTEVDEDSDSELWGGFYFPKLSPEEDVQLTIALQGGTPEPQQTTSIIETKSASAIVADDSSRMRSGIQGPGTKFCDMDSASQPTPGVVVSSPMAPPSYMDSELSENSNTNHFFIIDDHSVIPISSTDRRVHIVRRCCNHQFC